MSRKQQVWPWSDLGLDGPVPLRAVKRAYALRLKAIDRGDPAAFQALQQVFDAAKARALPDVAPVEPTESMGARPSMAQIVGAAVQAPRHSPTPGFAAPDSDDTSVPQQEAAAETPDQRAGQSSAMAAPADPPHAIDTAPVPEAAQPSAPEPAPARPWGAATSDLDALHDSDPARALAVFWQRFNAAVPEASSWKWDLPALDRLLSLRLRHVVPGLNAQVEAHFFAALGTSLDWSRAWVSHRVATLLETHFAWTSDGVRFRRQFGNRAEFPLVAHALSQSVPRDGVSAAVLANRPYKVIKVGIFGLAMLSSIVAFWMETGGGNRPAEALFVSIFVGAILFAIAYYVVMVLLAFVRVPLVATGLDQPLLRLARRVAPGLMANLERSGETRSVLYWSLCALAVAAFMLLPKL